MNAQAVDHQHPRLAPPSGLTEKLRPVVPERQNARPSMADAEGEKGVLRLLEDGHFRGVADVRLRINFHEELTRANSQKAVSEVADNAPALLQELAEKVRMLGEDNGLGVQAADLAEAFAGEAMNLLENAKAGQGSLDTALKDIDAAFSTFMASLRDSVAQDPAVAAETTGETVLEETQSADAAAEEGANALDESKDPEVVAPSALQNAVDELGVWFTDSLAALKETALAGQELPPLSAPQGKGKAYSKFLEIYREMSAGTLSAQPENPPTAGDLSVEA